MNKYFYTITCNGLATTHNRVMYFGDSAESIANMMAIDFAASNDAVDEFKKDSEFYVKVYTSMNASMHVGYATGKVTGTRLPLNSRILGFTDDMTHADLVNFLNEIYLRDHYRGLISDLKAYRKKIGKPVHVED